ncbi:MAG TPA: hypothetical protein VML91_27745 [Burkholderiales bacterium]|nr:hypothetical protein [Burkholderiales bacterium]
MNRLTTTLLCGALALASVAVHGQNTVRVRGTIVSLEGNVLAVKSREGQDLKIQLTDKTGVAYVTALTIADIKPGDGLGTTAVARPDGTLVAREIHTFPPSLGVPNEGHRPWDDAGASMTNARVSALVQAADGRELTLTWKDGSRKLLVPPGTPIVSGVDADRSFLKAGEYVYLNAQVGADDRLTAIGRVQVSKDGVRPPQ